MRLKMSALLVFARLSWGEFSSPVHWQYNLAKFFPPPRIVVHKPILLRYFSRN